MKNSILALLLLCMLFTMSACSKSGSSGGSSKDNDETVAFATKMDLFNELESIIKKIPQKKYSDAYDALSNVFKLSNKSGFVADPKDGDSKKYITDLNQFATDVFNQSKIEKEQKVSYDYQKSQLNILSNVLSGSSGQSQSPQGQSGSGSTASSGEESGSGSGSESKDSGGSSSSGAAGQEQAQGKEGEQKGADIVIPAEEMREKHPELTLTQTDFSIYNMASDLLGYVSKVTLESKPENETALANREKYLLYKILALSKLDSYVGAKEFIVEAQSNWGKLYIKIPAENQQDVVTFNALLKNIETSLSKKNVTAVELQTKLAIELLDTLSSKMKSS